MADVPKVFISYSWDSIEHKNKVLSLAQALRDDGIDCMIDQFVLSPDNWQRWMIDRIDESQFILIVCTERYYRRYRAQEEVNKGLGVTWESTLILDDIYTNQGKNSKFYPIFFDSPNQDITPDGISTSSYDLSKYDLLNLDIDETRLKVEGGYQELYRLLTNQLFAKPYELGSLKQLPTYREPEKDLFEYLHFDQNMNYREIEEVLTYESTLADSREKVDFFQSVIKYAVKYMERISRVGMDYTRLQKLLEAGKWELADQETADLLISLIEKFRLDIPCSELCTIDNLWFKGSNGHFGFSKQIKVLNRYYYRRYGNRDFTNAYRFREFSRELLEKNLRDMPTFPAMFYRTVLFSPDWIKGQAWTSGLDLKRRQDWLYLKASIYFHSYDDTILDWLFKRFISCLT